MGKPKERDDYGMDWKGGGRRTRPLSDAWRTRNGVRWSIAFPLPTAIGFANPARRCRLRPLRPDEQPLLKPASTGM
jgi:hypothetical protein